MDEQLRSWNISQMALLLVVPLLWCIKMFLGKIVSFLCNENTCSEAIPNLLGINTPQKNNRNVDEDDK